MDFSSRNNQLTYIYSDGGTRIIDETGSQDLNVVYSMGAEFVWGS